MGSVLKKTTYNTAEGGGRIEEGQAHLLVQEINALLCPRDLKEPITFDNLIMAG
jgi:hypothetical protein